MKCSFVVCNNEGRYIDEDGQLVCGICPLKLGLDSIKIKSVPALLRWCRETIRLVGFKTPDLFALREIIGRGPEDHHGDVIEDAQAKRVEGAP